MNAISVVCIVVFFLFTVIVFVAFEGSYRKYKQGKKSIMFESEDKYKVVVVKNGEEYIVSRNLTIDEARKEIESINTYAKIIKEED